MAITVPFTIWSGTSISQVGKGWESASYAGGPFAPSEAAGESRLELIDRLTAPRDSIVLGGCISGPGKSSPQDHSSAVLARILEIPPD